MTREDRRTIEDVVSKLNSDVYKESDGKLKDLYPDNWVFNDEQTVGWNREKVIRDNNEIIIYNNNIKQHKFRGLGGFASDLKESISNELDINLNQAQPIYRQAWEEGHSGGLREVISYAEDLIFLFKQVKEAE